MQVMLVNLIAFGSQLRASSIVSPPMSACVGAYIDNSCIIRVPIRHERNWNTRAPPFPSSTKLVRLLIYHPLFNAWMPLIFQAWIKLRKNIRYVCWLFGKWKKYSRYFSKESMTILNKRNQLKNFFNRKIKIKSSILQRRSIKLVLRHKD